MCRRGLKNPESLVLGVGPECRDKQQKFLAACGTSLEEVGQLTLIDDETIVRRLRAFAGAARRGHIEIGIRFLNAARRDAAWLASNSTFEIAGIETGNEVSAVSGDSKGAELTRDLDALGINL